MPTVVRRGGSPPIPPTKHCCRGQLTASRSISFRIGQRDWDVWNIPADGGAATRVTQGGACVLRNRRTGVPVLRERRAAGVAALASGPVIGQLVTTFTTGTHWGGDWIVGARGLYYLNEQTAGAAGIDFLPFGEPQTALFACSP